MIALQFSTERAFTSLAIRYFCWSKYSHVDLVLPDGRLLGARSNGGVMIRPPHYEEFSSVARYTIETPNDEAIYAAAKSQIGKPYDFVAILNFITHGRDWRHGKAWICSELVAWAFEQGGMPLVNPDIRVSRVTPQQVLMSPYLKREEWQTWL